MSDLRPGLIFDIAHRAGITFERGSTDSKKRLKCIESASHKHGDKHPSAFLSGEKNCFHCSGCGLTLTAKEFAARVGVEWKTDALRQHLAGNGKMREPSRIKVQKLSGDFRQMQQPLKRPDLSALHLEPVTDHKTLCAQLQSRAIDPAHVADRDLAFAVVGPLPWWAGRKPDESAPRVTWLQSGHGLVLRMYGATGKAETVHARRLVPPSIDDGAPKGLSPAGYNITGTVFADPLARLLLEKGAAPAWWTQRTVIVAEGVPDFLTWATHYGDSEDAPAIFGVISGSWSPAIAARIPDGCEILIRTHTDAAGRKYASDIADTLRSRCRVFTSAIGNAA